jgi:hypothetical protein
MRKRVLWNIGRSVHGSEMRVPEMEQWYGTSYTAFSENWGKVCGK